MAHDEPLIPKNLPQGERQKVREGMVRAGIPLGPPADGADTPRLAAQPRAATSSPAPPDRGVLGLLDGRSPADFPFLASPGPDRPAAADPGTSVVAALAASAQSDFARAVAARLAQL